VDRSRNDYYRILQVDPSANPLVIQAAYRVLARIFHPDVQGDDDEQMKRLNRAWEVLGDPRRRAAYDSERAGRHTGPVASTSPAATARHTTADAPSTRTRSDDLHAAFAANAAARDTAAAGAQRPAPPPPPPSPAPASPAPTSRVSEDHAGPPRGEPYGPVLTFGRYEGWSLGQVARVDREFLEWLKRAPAGRSLKHEIDAVLRSMGISGVDRRRYDADVQRVHTWAPGAPTRIR
jgi:curved DNA-binding protein CbpA